MRRSGRLTDADRASLQAKAEESNIPTDEFLDEIAHDLEPAEKVSPAQSSAPN